MTERQGERWLEISTDINVNDKEDFVAKKIEVQTQEFRFGRSEDRK